MIKSIRAKNFKSWQDTDDIRVAPVTGFFGTNSSGKTSLLQMLLLLKQTAQSSDPRQVIFFGDEDSLINLGTFDDLIHNHDLDKNLEMSVMWQDDRTPYIRTIFQTTILSFTTSIHQMNEGQVVEFLEYKGGNNFANMHLVGDEEKRQQVDHSIPLNFVGNMDFAFDRKIVPVKCYEFPGIFADEKNLFYNIGFFLEQQLSNIAYLGPLREYPRRTYLWGGDAPSDMGRRGERTIPALLSKRNENDGKYLERKVAYWLQRMGLIHSFSLRPIAPGRRDYEIVVKKTANSAEVLITDIGFGVSQILPVLVLCYYVPEGSTIIFEQPEIHLHPSVQADLADLFIEVARERHVQIIFESHSEYLLHRLQRRIAEEQLSKDEAALYFCHMGDEASQIEELRLDEYGNIANWPKDFFGDSTGDLVAMTEAAMKRKLAEQT